MNFRDSKSTHSELLEALTINVAILMSLAFNTTSFLLYVVSLVTEIVPLSLIVIFTAFALALPAVAPSLSTQYRYNFQLDESSDFSVS
jgi:hypothetical protein